MPSTFPFDPTSYTIQTTVFLIASTTRNIVLRGRLPRQGQKPSFPRIERGAPRRGHLSQKTPKIRVFVKARARSNLPLYIRVLQDTCQTSISKEGITQQACKHTGLIGTETGHLKNTMGLGPEPANSPWPFGDHLPFGCSALQKLRSRY